MRGRRSVLGSAQVPECHPGRSFKAFAVRLRLNVRFDRLREREREKEREERLKSMKIVARN